MTNARRHGIGSAGIGGLSRRQVLGTAMLPLVLPASVRSAPIFQTNPFSLGVASGDPGATSIVLWTRIAPQPLLPDGGMPHVPVEVEWELSADSRFANRTRSGKETAFPELGHAVHVEVDGLEPGRDYFYRFKVGSERSITGRARTLPAAGWVGETRFGVMGCQRYEYAHFGAHADMAREALDFVFCYGDFIYEYRSARLHEDSARVVRELPLLADECVSLADYRQRHAIYRLDPQLQAASRAAPLIPIFDDHEVSNDWLSDVPQDARPTALLLMRRAAAFQAWYESMPVRRSALPRGPDLTAWRRFDIGGLIRMSVLDTRQYRPGRFCEGKLTSECAADGPDARYTMLGDAQEAWLADGLKERAQPVWTVLAQQVLMSPAPIVPKSDKWDRVPLARQRLFDLLAESRAPNPVVLSGDLHYGLAADLHRDAQDPASAVIGSELLGYAVASRAPGSATDDFFARLRQAGPQVKFLSRERGWTRHTVSGSLWRAEFRALDDPTRADSAVRSAGVLTIEAGRPGLRVE